MGEEESSRGRSHPWRRSHPECEVFWQEAAKAEQRALKGCKKMEGGKERTEDDRIVRSV